MWLAMGLASLLTGADFGRGLGGALTTGLVPERLSEDMAPPICCLRIVMRPHRTDER